MHKYLKFEPDTLVFSRNLDCLSVIEENKRLLKERKSQRDRERYLRKKAESREIEVRGKSADEIKSYDEY